MRKGDTKKTAFASDAERDAEIARFEAMSREEVEAELRKADIDPARTVKAVEELVRAALARWQSDDSTKTS